MTDVSHASGKRLYLLRHAKSSWDDPMLDDHERPLAPRGRKGAKRMAEYLRRNAIHPALILCSSAIRARETLERLDTALAEEVAVEIEPELYGASDEELLARVRRVPERVPSVLMIGHNPGMEDLARTLARGGADLPAMLTKYPTGALAILGFRGQWRTLRPGLADLIGFVVPKDLEPSR